MSATENRIVKMVFDNAQFKKAAGETQKSLADVDKAVSNSGKSRGLLDLAGHIDTVRVKAGAMQVAMVTALGTIVSRATNAGINLAKSLSLDPIKQGFDEYELKMKSIQTILANTKGETLKSVSAALSQLNTYSDKTIYNFANMTENIGKLTTAGIDLKTATSVVKGFHNMVALAGGDATAAAGAMEQFGQGLQAGSIHAMDWMSISTRGLGSQSLQKAFYESAKAVGTLTNLPVGQTFEEWSKANGGFKASLESGWLTTEVATTALSAVTGDVKSVQELMKQGFSEQAAKDMLDLADKALDSATKVRTFTAFMDTTKEALGSGWGQVMEIIFGDFNESTKLFTKLSGITGKYIKQFFGYVVRLLNAFDKLGGRTAVLETIKNLLSPILAILGLLAKAWKLVFGGGDTGKGLSTFAKALQHITRPLRVFSELITGQITPMHAWHRIIEIVSHAIRNFSDYLGGTLDPLGKFISMKVPGGDGILHFIKSMAEELKKTIQQIDDLVKKGASLSEIFNGVTSFDMPDLPGLPALPSLPAIGGILGSGGDDAQVAGLAGSIESLTGGMTKLKDASEDTYNSGMFNPDADISGGLVRDVGTMGQTAQAAINDRKSLWDSFLTLVGGIKDRIVGFIKDMSFDDLMASFNIAVLSVFFYRMSDMFKAFSSGARGIGGVFEGLETALGSFQTTARAHLIKSIAIAIGILAVSLAILSFIPMKKLANGLAALGAVMLLAKIMIGGMVKAVEGMDKKGATAKLVGLSLALIALSVAIGILAVAFLILQKVKWESVLKGLILIRVVMMSFEKIGELAKHAAKNMFAAGAAMVMMGISMAILAGALLLFQKVKWESMAKAGLVLLALTVSLGLLAEIPDAEIAKIGVAMLAMSVGLLTIANALIIFQAVKWESIGKAGVVLAALTASIALLMWVGGGPAGAAAMLGIGAAMVLLATAGLMLNKVDWSAILKLTVILGILIAGFAAFLFVITAFAPALILLSLFAGELALLALALTGLALAFAVIFPLLAAGTGVFAAFATGAAVAVAVFMTTLAAEAPILKKAFLDILQALIDTIVEAVPMIIDGIKRLWEAVKAQFTGGGGKGGSPTAFMGTQGKSWVEKLSDGVKKYIPLIVKKAKELFIRFIDGLSANIGKIAAKGAEFVTNLINGIANNIGGIVDAAVNLVVKFAEGLGNNLERIVKAGIKLIADFLHALATGIRTGSAAIGGGITDVLDAMKDVGVNMVKGIIAGLESMVGDAMGAIADLASDMVGKAKSVLQIFSPSRVFASIGKFLVMGLTKGIKDHAASAITSVASLVSGQIAVATEYISGFVQRLDQQAIAATAKAEGLAAAAEEAQRSAEAAARRADKTKKNKKDDKAANKASKAADEMAKKAERADKRAQRLEERSQAAKDASARAEQFAEASTLEQAQMRSEDAQNQMDAAKAAETGAAAKLQQAAALREQAKAKGVSNKDAKEMRKHADELEKQAKTQATRANTLISTARLSALDSIRLQAKAGDEAAALYQQQFDQAAADDAASAAYEKLSDSDKAAARRRDADILNARAQKDLADAKKLAYTDLEAANELASQAQAEAEQARQYLADAVSLEQTVAQGTGTSAVETGGTVVNLDPTQAASIAFGNYEGALSSAEAAAAGDRTVQFNQYNTSPEALNPTDVYRLTNNQVSFALSKLDAA